MNIFPIVLAFFALMTPFNIQEDNTVDPALEIERTNYLSLIEQWFGPSSTTPHEEYHSDGRGCGLQAESLGDISECLEIYSALKEDLDESPEVPETHEPEVPETDEPELPEPPEEEIEEETTEPEVTPTEPDSEEEEPSPVINDPVIKRPRPTPSNPTRPTESYQPDNTEDEDFEPYRSETDGFIYTSQPLEDVFYLRQGLLIRENDYQRYYFRFQSKDFTKEFEENTLYTILYRTAELGSQDMMVINRILKEEPMPEEEPETSEVSFDVPDETEETNEPLIMETPQDPTGSILARIVLGIFVASIVVITLVVLSIKNSKIKLKKNEKASGD